MFSYDLYSGYVKLRKLKTEDGQTEPETRYVPVWGKGTSPDDAKKWITDNLIAEYYPERDGWDTAVREVTLMLIPPKNNYAIIWTEAFNLETARQAVKDWLDRSISAWEASCNQLWLMDGGRHQKSLLEGELFKHFTADRLSTLGCRNIEDGTTLIRRAFNQLMTERTQAANA